MTSVRHVLIAGIILHASIANAAVVFSSFGPGLGYDPANGINIDGSATMFPQGIAEPFSPSASSTLDSVELAVSRTAGAAQLNVRVYSDAAGMPGDLIEEAPLAGFANGVVTADFSGQLVLGGGTNYWFGVFTDDSNRHIWHDSSSGLPALQAASADDGASWTILSSDPFPRAAFRVNGTAVTPPGLSLIPEVAAWRFCRGLAEPSPSVEWTTSSFVDTAWDFGNAGFGYDTDPATQAGLMSAVGTPLLDMREDGINPNPYTVLYLRRNFSVADPAALAELILQLDYDDSFIAYINGTEIARSAFGTVGVAEPFDALGNSHESTNGDPAMPLSRFAIDLINDFPGLLHAGADNVLAIQGLNVALDDSDFVLSRISLGANSNATSPTGDYSDNGIVDAADYAVWRNHQGTTNALPNDPIGGAIGQVHYDQWRSRFGQPSGNGSAINVHAAVPEPATVVLMFIGIAATCGIQRAVRS